ncbi:MAG: membrane protein insertase YidC, partial [Deltaproteobacteria bacterium]|nr:membrane protein insertase YidC [Deltaproteobacteria bacterium]
MDQFRMLMAVVLSFIVFMVWQFVFVKPEPAQKDTPVETQAPAQPDNSYVDAVRKPLQPTAPMTSPEPTPTKPIRLAKAITIDTPLYSARLSENGAVIKSMKLKKYRETVDKAS